jgi:hypothetical protein
VDRRAIRFVAVFAAAAFALGDFLADLEDFFEAFRDVLVALRAVRLAIDLGLGQVFAHAVGGVGLATVHNWSHYAAFCLSQADDVC